MAAWYQYMILTFWASLAGLVWYLDTWCMMRTVADPRSGWACRTSGSSWTWQVALHDHLCATSSAGNLNTFSQHRAHLEHAAAYRWDTSWCWTRTPIVDELIMDVLVFGTLRALSYWLFWQLTHWKHDLASRLRLCPAFIFVQYFQKYDELFKFN